MMGFAGKLASLAALGALAAAPAALAQVYNVFDRGPPPSYQTYAHTLSNGTRDGGVVGGYDESLGTSDRGIPAEAQAQAGAMAQSNPYDQWDYTGWSGLTKHGASDQRNTDWSAQDTNHYIQASPPR